MGDLGRRTDPLQRLCRNRVSRSDPTGLRSRQISVSMGPGATAFTVMPVRASSLAQIRVQVSSAAFAAAYGVRSGVPSVVKLVTLTMRPPPRGAQARQDRLHDLHGGAHVEVVGVEQVIQIDRADDAEARETHVVDHRIDGDLADDLVQRRRGRCPIGKVDLVKPSRKIRGRCAGKPIGSWPPQASRSATTRPMPFDAPVINTRRDGMTHSLRIVMKHGCRAACRQSAACSIDRPRLMCRVSDKKRHNGSWWKPVRVRGGGDRRLRRSEAAGCRGSG